MLYVIDMCVKMLNPQEDEYMIDTAAGSSGFPVHTIFHVWRQILDDEGLEASHLFSLEDKPPRCTEYVEEKVFAIDFDEKAVRVARTLNLIAGDGQTNVLHLNTLDYELWDEITDQEEWDDIYNTGFKRLKRLRPKSSKDYREFQFDVLMANPPFAGDIKEPRMISSYDLAKKPDGKWQTKVGRDILFIERNLDFLKPGGRMAIVLPQGRFNNSSDKNIRDFIAERCRILAVVGLHGNTFKPHTGTKTSVLFVQKWNDDPKAGALCPRRDDYNIFFATMRKSGKDNSGEKIWRRVRESLPEIPPPPLEKGGFEVGSAVGVEGTGLDADLKKGALDSNSPLFKGGRGGSELLKDRHDHLIVDHDLYNHEGLTEDGIAEAFIEFAKKEQLSFFEPSPSVTPFDAARYQRLMDGLEAVELNLSEVVKHNITFRVDSEFFETKYLEVEQAINSKANTLLDTLASWITQGPNPNFSEDENDIHCLNGRNIAGGAVNYEGSDYVSESEYQNLERFQIKKNDILITLKGYGSIGKIGFVSTIKRSIFSRDVGIVRLKKNTINPAYLFVFLLSKYGILTIDRGSTGGTGQRTLTTTYLKNMYIPRFKFEDLIGKFVHDSEELLKQSSMIYQQAEDLLLSELGLQDWQPTEETFAVKSFAESFLSSGRFDAEYYQPKFDQLIARLEEKVELTLLGDLLTLNQRGKQPIYIEDENEYGLGFPVVNSKHVREGEVILTDNRYAYLPETDVPLTIQTDDILINGTGVGTIGRCSPYLYEQEALPDNHVTILRTNLLDSAYLSIYLNSIIGKLFVEKHFKGSSGQIELYPNEIAQFQIWNAPESIQKKIRSKVEVSHQKREQSKQLLEIAKTGVERAIETDEATATTWINEQLKNLEINSSSMS
jgi:type I restriction enzyme M protein